MQPDSTESAFRDRQAVTINARVMSRSATGDYYTVEVLTKAGVTYLAIPKEHIHAGE
jgi:hypothetical protein